MTLSQWTGSSTGTIVTESLNTSGPIEGTSSIYWDMINSGTTIIRAFTTGANVTTGKIRTCFKLVQGGFLGAADNTRPFRYGVFGMIQSSLAYSSNAYQFLICDDGNTAAPYPASRLLYKGAIGDPTIGSGIPSNALSYSQGSISTSTITMELKWQRDSSAAQELLTASLGSATDFSDLASLLQYTDGSPYSSGLSAGICAKLNNGGAGYQLTTKFDITQLFKV